MNYELIYWPTTQLMTELTDNSDKKSHYAYGWDVRKSSKHGRIIEHTGSQQGASGFFRIYFDKKVVVTSLANNLNSNKEVRSFTIGLATRYFPWIFRIDDLEKLEIPVHNAISMRLRG